MLTKVSFILYNTHIDIILISDVSQHGEDRSTGACGISSDESSLSTSKSEGHVLFIVWVQCLSM